MNTQHTPQSMQKLARGFTQSRVFITAAELDLFTLLTEKAQTATAVASTRNANLRGMTILLDALTAQGFLLKQEGRYQTEPSVAPYLSADSPNSILPMILHSVGLWKRWSKLTDIVLGQAEPEAENTDDRMLQTLVKAMHSANYAKAPEVVKQIQAGTARSLLDVGGGAGTYTLAFLQAVSDMRATLFDFPSIVPIAEAQLRAEGMDSRVQFAVGNYLEDDLPEGHDLALLSAIIHQHSPAENGVLYKKVYQALKPSGRIVIRGFVMDENKTQPAEGALFAVNMLTSTQGGQTYSFNEIQDGLEQAGFTRVRLLFKADGLFSLIDAFKP